MLSGWNSQASRQAKFELELPIFGFVGVYSLESVLTPFIHEVWRRLFCAFVFMCIRNNEKLVHLYIFSWILFIKQKLAFDKNPTVVIN